MNWTLKISQILAVLSLFFCSFVYPADYNLKFEKLTTLDGLSQSTIYTIFQDSAGFLWFGTQDGLNRFDGYKFHVYRGWLDAHSDKFASNFIVTIAQDAKGRLWLGTATNGVSMFDPLTNKFERIKDRDIISGNVITKIICDRDNNIWIATGDAGVYRFSQDGSILDIFKHDPKDPTSINSNHISSLFEDTNGNIWIGLIDAGINIYSKKTRKIEHFLGPENDPLLQYGQITAISDDAFGRILLGTQENGLFLLSPHTMEVKNYIHKNSVANSIISNRVNTVYRDKNQRLWVGTDMGLSLFKEDDETFKNYFHQKNNPNSLSSNKIISIYEDYSGVMWIGTYNTGLNRFNPSYSVFNNYKQSEEQNNLTSNTVWSIYEDNDKWWVGTNQGLNLFDNNTERFVHLAKNAASNDVVRTILKTGDGRLLLGTNGSGVYVYNPMTDKIVDHYYFKSNDPNSLSGNHIRCFLQNKDNSIWIGTMSGLSLWQPQQKKFYRFTNSPSDSSSLSDNRVMSLLKDRKGRLWIGTYNGLNIFNPENKTFELFRNIHPDSNQTRFEVVISMYQSPLDSDDAVWIGTSYGLFQFDYSNRTFTQYQTRDGLPNNVIYRILEDDQGYLWLSTNKGISRFDRKTKQFKNFDSNDGIDNTEYSAGAGLKLSSGRLVFGGISGLTAFSPYEIPNNNIVPNVVITSFKKFDKEVPVEGYIKQHKVLNLTYEDKYISLEFAALDFTNSSKNKYKYMLEGFDKDWIFAGTRRYASYTNLDGGHYTFKVLGSNNDGVWNEKGAELKIYVEPPYWKTFWFQQLILWSFLLLLIVIYKSRLSRINKQRAELKEKVTERTQELYNRNIELKREQNERDRILLNVEEGFFLLNKELTIQSQYSAALLKILGHSDVGGKNFLELLKECLPEEDVRLTKEYLALLWKKDLHEDLIRSLNPLEKAEFYFKAKDNKDRTKFLTFRFNRIVENEEITGLIVTTIDETEEYILSLKLAESESKSQKQVEWLLGVMQIDPALLNEFITTAFSEFENIQGLLKGNDELRPSLDVITQLARSLHFIKGNANLLDLKFFAQKVHELETEVNTLKNPNKFSEHKFQTFIENVSVLKNNFEELNQLIEKFANFNKTSMVNEPPPTVKNEAMLHTVHKMVQRLAATYNKEVKFEHNSFDCTIVPSGYKSLLKNILIQFVKNSIFHGIEGAVERVRKGKNTYGTITLSNNIENNYFKITYIDDGRGLQYEKLREMAIHSNLWQLEEVAKWSKRDLAKTIFLSGFSSAENIDTISGRGIGMNLIYDQIQKNNGNIDVSSTESEFCRFDIYLPLVNNN